MTCVVIRVRVSVAVNVLQLKRLQNKRKNRRKKDKKRMKKERALSNRIESIKDSNLVHNFSSMDVPDEAYLFLSLGSSFIPAAMSKKHDDVYDTKLFARKLRWRAFFEEKKGRLDQEPELVEETGNVTNAIVAPQRLKPKGSSQPLYQNRRLEDIIGVMSERVANVDKKKISSNLTHQELKGLNWCVKNIRKRVVYITKVDKGGSIIILDSSTVEQTMAATLDNTVKYEQLSIDPRPKIRLDIIELVDKYVNSSLLTPVDRQ